MKRIVLSGCNGRMGQILAACIKARDDCCVVAGIDPGGMGAGDFPVYTAPESCDIPADVIIDFSHPNALSPLLRHAVKTHTPTVIATTGLSEEQIALIRQTAKEVPLFFTFNMSLGVNLLAELAKKAAAVLGERFDIEIIEKHHNQKIDAPSGTALMLADAVSSVFAHPPDYIYDRHAHREKRGQNEIGIHTVRGGTIVGEHEIIFAGHDETITLSHTAASKEVFATGSINAAIFLCGRKNGLYNMSDIV